MEDVGVSGAKSEVGSEEWRKWEWVVINWGKGEGGIKNVGVGGAESGVGKE